MVDLEEMELELKREDRLSKYDGEDRVVLIGDIVNNLKNEEEPKVLNTGLFRTDTTTSGFEFGELIVIAGATGNGKTSFARNITQHLSLMDHRSLWFSYEMGIRNFIKSFGKDLPSFCVPAKNLR
jgi:replicative DNA helicase